VIWLLVIAVVAAGAVGIFFAIGRASREIPRALQALDNVGRELRPALVRVRTSTDELRARRTGS
jgi:hypothetical protein